MHHHPSPEGHQSPSSGIPPQAASPRRASGNHRKHQASDFKRRFWVCLLLTLPVLFLSPMIRGILGWERLHFPGDLYLLFLLASVIYFYGGYPFLRGFKEELWTHRPGMMTLIAVAITTAYVYSTLVVFGIQGKVFFWELATLIDIMLLGHWLEMRSVSGASRALEELAKLMPAVAHRLLPKGQTEEVPVSQLRPGDRLLVKPGEKIPADGLILEGQSTLNEALLTGESRPITKKAGQKVIGGSLNGEGSLTIEVTKTEKDSFLAQVIDLVRQAQESKSKTQDLANRAAFWLTLVALGGGGLTFLLWRFWLGQEMAFSLERTVTVMVITCPHALGLAIPLVVAVSTAIAAKHGLLIRHRAAFEQARKVTAVVFDKTGTLTKGEFGVTDIWPLKGKTSQEILRLAASLEAHSEHPIARGIVAAAKEFPKATHFVSLPGRGAEGETEGKRIKVVSPGYLKEKGLPIPEEARKMAAQGKTVVFVLEEDQLIGVIALADIIRPEAAQAVAHLKARGIRCLMLTGDNAQVARFVAEEIGLDAYFAEVLPHEKAQKIREIKEQGHIVAMTGDGVNDAPALAEADCGIAIGAGTDVAIETADVILVRNNPQDVVTILELSRATYRKMVQNLLWATGYNAFAIPLAAGVLYSQGLLLSPAVGALFMSLSTIVVAINAKLLRLKKKF